jgi:hypothetical protein
MFGHLNLLDIQILYIINIQNNYIITASDFIGCHTH